MKGLPDAERDRPQHSSQRVLAHLEARYAFHVMRHLCEKPRTFGELRELTGTASTSTLSIRLQELQRCGWIDHHGRHYALTPIGARLCPAVQHVLHWHAQLDDRAPAIRDIVQRRGSLGIILTLQAGPTRARDLNFEAVSRRSVMARLRELTDIGFLIRTSSSATAPYALSTFGHQFSPAAHAILTWISEQDGPECPTQNTARLTGDATAHRPTPGRRAPRSSS